MSLNPFLGDLLFSPPAEQTNSPENLFRWATVTDNNPLQILLDGDTAPLATRPDSLTVSASVGDRVWCQIYRKRVVVLGKAVGTMGEWNVPSLQSPWGPVDFAPPPRWKWDGTCLYLSGTVAASTSTSAPVFYLPPEIWPTGNTYFEVSGAEGSIQARVRGADQGANPGGLDFRGVGRPGPGTDFVALNAVVPLLLPSML